MEQVEQVMVKRPTGNDKAAPGVVIGSTPRDLSEHRYAAIETLREHGLRVIDEEPNDPTRARELVDQATIFVAILGTRYGYVPRVNNAAKQSIIEIQYRRAVERGIPIIPFFSADTAPRTGSTGELKDAVESGAKYRQKLKALKAEITERHDARWFTTPENLALRLSAILVRMGYTPIPVQPTTLESAPTSSSDEDDASSAASIEAEDLDETEEAATPKMPVAAEALVEAVPETSPDTPAPETLGALESAPYGAPDESPVVIESLVETATELPTAPEGVYASVVDETPLPAEMLIEPASDAPLEDNAPELLVPMQDEPDIISMETSVAAEMLVEAVPDVSPETHTPEILAPWEDEPDSVSIEMPLTAAMQLEAAPDVSPETYAPELLVPMQDEPDSISFDMPLAAEALAEAAPDVAPETSTPEILAAHEDMPGSESVEPQPIAAGVSSTEAAPAVPAKPASPEVSEEDELDETASDAPVIGIIPNAPHPYIAHLYIAPRRFVGRAYEIGTLNSWLNGPDSCLVVDGLSGIGKSALAWRWFRDQSRMGRIWWNFQEGATASINNFVRCALAYVTGQTLSAIDVMQPEARQNALLNALRVRPFLIVLDGLERLLVAYHRMDAPQLTDVTLDDKALRWSNPAHGAFLAKLALCQPSKVLMLTRHKPAELVGVRDIRLSGLTMIDSLSLLRSNGIRSASDSVARLAMQLENHPLTLRILAGYVGHRDYDAWWQDEGRAFANMAVEPAARRTLLLNMALDALSPASAHVLSQVAAFRFPISGDVLAVANPLVGPRLPKIPEPRRWQQGYVEAKAAWDANQKAIAERDVQVRESQPHVHAALDDLDARGLLLRDRITDKLDLSPVVRSLLMTRIEDLKTVFLRARDYYDTLPADKPDSIRDIGDAHRSVEIYRSTASAGLLDEAAEVFRSLLARMTRKASPHDLIELLMPMFPGGMRSLPPLAAAPDRGYFANELALALGSVGNRTEAMTLLGLAFEQFIEEGNSTYLCAALLNYAGLMRDDNQIAAKAHVFELARELATASHDTENLATANLFLLKIYADTGQWEPAEAAYTAFSANPPRIRTAYRQASAERNFAKMQVYREKDATATLALALQLAQESRSPHEQLAVFALWGETSLQQNRADAAEKFYQSAYEMAVQYNVPTANYAGGLARAYARQGRVDEARALVAKGVSRAAAAEVLLALGERDRAAKLAIEAYKLAWADGAPFSFWMELAQARKTLAALGIPEPSLPPFNPNSVRPVPHENEILAYIEKLKQQG